MPKWKSGDKDRSTARTAEESASATRTSAAACALSARTATGHNESESLPTDMNKNLYGCHNVNTGTTRSRSASVISFVQDGYQDVTGPNSSAFRMEPVYRIHTSQWNDTRCGYLGNMTDKQCDGCVHRGNK